MKFKCRWMFALLATMTTVWSAATAAEPQQSPIDIRIEDLTVQKLSHMWFLHSSRVNLDVFHNGETIRANLPFFAGHLWVDGRTYRLVQVHFHTHSEHLLQGEAAPMEMHLVHQTANGTLLVIGVFIVVGDRHQELDKIFADLPQEEGEHRLVRNFNLRKLLPNNLESYRYTGSLTTPPFTEGVKWIVLDQPVEMDADQVQAFMKLFPEGNAREVQPLNKRVVLTDVKIDHD